MKALFKCQCGREHTVEFCERCGHAGYQIVLDPNKRDEFNRDTIVRIQCPACNGTGIVSQLYVSEDRP